MPAVAVAIAVLRQPMLAVVVAVVVVVAVAVAVLHQPMLCTQLLASRRPLANAIMAHEIRSLLIKEMAAVQELCQARGIKADIDKALRCSCIREFDGALLVPSYGFQNVDEYYRQQSSGHVLKCLHAILYSCNALLVSSLAAVPACGPLDHPTSAYNQMSSHPCCALTTTVSLVLGSSILGVMLEGRAISCHGLLPHLLAH
eukprot:1139442-Pelagomonas_calceolata.AAC.6